MEQRKDKYQQKFKYILEKLNDLPLQESNNKYYWDIIFYRLYISIQSLMVIIAMLCKDIGVDVKDDYSNIEELNKKKLIDDELISKLKKLNGLRNVLVHKYNQIILKIN